MKPKIFIDGEVGTTGLEIRKRLESRADIELVSIDPAKRKDAAERKRLLNTCDLAILCLPDDAAREAVALIDNPAVKVLDASTAFRTAEGWAYGFPELALEQEGLIARSKRVSNPGCYPIGMLALIRPLVDAGLLPPDSTVIVNAISGYSGGGKELIDLCENHKGNPRGGPFCLYGLDQQHKHLPEMRVHSRLSADPVFLPSYSNAFYRGMLVTIALVGIDGEAAHAALTKRYAGKNYVKVDPLQVTVEKGFVLSPLAMNDTNNLQLRTFWNAAKKAVILTACLDNLGKGASGAAVQNLEIMLGFKTDTQSRS